MNQNGFITFTYITGLISFFSTAVFSGPLIPLLIFRLSFIICISFFLFVETYLAFAKACHLIQCAFSKQKLHFNKKIFKRFIIFTRKFTMQTLFNNEFLLLFHNNCDNFLKNYNFTAAKLNKF